MFIISYGYRQPKLGFKVQISIVFLGMLMFQLKISFLLIYTVYFNDSMWRPGRLFTFGGQLESAYLKQGGSQGQGVFFFGEPAECAKQSLDVYIKRRKGKRACCPYIFPGENEEPSRRGKHFICLKELCTHIYIIVERLRLRPLFWPREKNERRCTIVDLNVHLL